MAGLGTGTGTSAPAAATTGTATAPIPTFIMNPFLVDINPRTSEGAKLYNKATAKLDTKLTINQKNAKDVLSHFIKDAGRFGWGPLIGQIQINNAGNTLPL